MTLDHSTSRSQEALSCLPLCLLGIGDKRFLPKNTTLWGRASAMLFPNKRADGVPHLLGECYVVHQCLRDRLDELAHPSQPPTCRLVFAPDSFLHQGDALISEGGVLYQIHQFRERRCRTDIYPIRYSASRQRQKNPASTREEKGEKVT